MKNRDQNSRQQNNIPGMRNKRGNYLQAEWLKYRHSSAGKLCIFMPLVTVITSAFMTHKFFTVDSYNWWYTMMFPGMLSLLCGIVIGKDQKMKNHSLLSIHCDMGRVWDAKVFCAASFGGIGCLFLGSLTVLVGYLLEWGLHFQFQIRPSLGAQMLAIVLIWIGFLWMVPFGLFLTRMIGKIPATIALFAMAMVVDTSYSLTSYYWVLPGGVAARMMCVVLGVLPNGLPARPGEMTWTQQVMDPNSLWIGTISAVVWFLILWIAGKIWYERRMKK